MTPTAAEVREAIAGLKKHIEWNGPDHDDDCPGDDTCECSMKPMNDGVNAAYRVFKACAETLERTCETCRFARAPFGDYRGCLGALNCTVPLTVNGRPFGCAAYESRPDQALERTVEQGTCEHLAASGFCGRRAVLRYPAMGGGFMRCCVEHGDKHLAYCEIWDGEVWQPRPDGPKEK